jgi:hypothetical protein
MIVKEYKVLNIKTGKVIVMNDNSIKALKKHNLWHGFDILEKPIQSEIPVVNKIVQSPIIVEMDETTIIESPIVVETIIDESPIEDETEKPKRKYKKS